jgi:hypothetical protein
MIVAHAHDCDCDYCNEARRLEVSGEIPRTPPWPPSKPRKSAPEQSHTEEGKR